VYHYADGSANVYKIYGDSISYIPVTKAQSSSGEYSGGEPKTIAITSEQKEKLIKLLELALDSTNQQQERREMMTGMLSKSLEEEEIKKVILKSKSALKNQIETYLKDLLDIQR
jgi:hypothetical protein